MLAFVGPQEESDPPIWSRLICEQSCKKKEEEEEKNLLLRCKMPKVSRGRTVSTHLLSLELLWYQIPQLHYTITGKKKSTNYIQRKIFLKQ